MILVFLLTQIANGNCSLLYTNLFLTDSNNPILMMLTLLTIHLWYKFRQPNLTEECLLCGIMLIFLVLFLLKLSSNRLQFIQNCFIFCVYFLLQFGWDVINLEFFISDLFAGNGGNFLLQFGWGAINLEFLNSEMFAENGGNLIQVLKTKFFFIV